MDARLKLFKAEPDYIKDLNALFPDAYEFKRANSSVVGIPIQVSSSSVREVMSTFSMLGHRPRQIAVSPERYFGLFVETLAIGGSIGEVQFSSEIDPNDMEYLRQAFTDAEGMYARSEIAEHIRQPFYWIIDEYCCYVVCATLHFGYGLGSVQYHLALNGIMSASRKLTQQDIEVLSGLMVAL